MQAALDFYPFHIILLKFNRTWKRCFIRSSWKTTASLPDNFDVREEGTVMNGEPGRLKKLRRGWFSFGTCTTDHSWKRSVQAQRSWFNCLTWSAMQDIWWKNKATLCFLLFYCKHAISRKPSVDEMRPLNLALLSQPSSKERSHSILYWSPEEKPFRNYIPNCLWLRTKLCIQWKATRFVVAPRKTGSTLLSARGGDSDSRYLCNFRSWTYSCALT